MTAANGPQLIAGGVTITSDLSSGVVEAIKTGPYTARQIGITSARNGTGYPAATDKVVVNRTL